MSIQIYTRIAVSGSSLAAFKQWLGGQPLDLENIIPIPNELKNRRPGSILTQEQSDVLVKKYGASNPIDWIKTNWGAKNIGYADETADANGNTPSYVKFEQDGTLIMIFWTNGVPEAAINTLSKQFPGLTFDLTSIYQGWLNGIARIRNGITQTEEVGVFDPRFREIAEGFADEIAGVVCTITLVVSGPNLDDYRQWLGEGELSLNKILPIPDELLKDNIQRHRFRPNPHLALREWCIKHWGTPLDIDNYFEDKISPQEIVTCFTTYWSPPILAIKYLSLGFPSLTFVLSHSRLHVNAGIYICRNGECCATEGDETQSIYHRVMTDMENHLEDKEAETLANQEGDLQVDHSYISDTAMRSLSTHKGHLQLWLEALSDEGAAALSEHRGSLNLFRLSWVTDNAAEELAEHKGDILLNGITELSDEAAESLAKHTGTLWLNGLWTLSDAAATSLAKHKGTIGLFGLENLSDKATEVLNIPKVLRSPADLTELSEYVAGEFVYDEGTLCLNSLMTLSDKAAKELAKHKGMIELKGLKTLSAAAAKILLEHRNIICEIDLKTIANGK